MMAPQCFKITLKIIKIVIGRAFGALEIQTVIWASLSQRCGFACHFHFGGQVTFGDESLGLQLLLACLLFERIHFFASLRQKK